MRYRLIPSRGTRNTPHHFWAADDDEAEYLAQRKVTAGNQALLCRAPEDGIVREVCVIGSAPQPIKRGR